MEKGFTSETIWNPITNFDWGSKNVQTNTY